MGFVEMLCRMLVFGRVAAPDVSAFQAQAQVNPIVAYPQALLAPFRSTRHNGPNLIQM
jgi:hypothetical protein